MNSLLAIETSGALCSVCLHLDGNRFSRLEHADKRHNELLLPMLTAVRIEAGLDERSLLESLDAVAFGRGPGSFTGVRIAAAAAQAIALAAGARIVRVASSEALAAKALAKDAAAPGLITLIRSRRDLHYVASYRCESGQPTAVAPNQLYDHSPAADWYERHAGWRAVGAVPGWWQGNPVLSLLADAEQVADIALRMLERGEHVAVEQGLPEYLDGDSTWRKSR